MTKAKPVSWIVETRPPGKGQFWRSVVQTDDEAKALEVYRQAKDGWPSDGGVRMIRSGQPRPVRYFGELGKPRKETP